MIDIHTHPDIFRNLDLLRLPEMHCCSSRSSRPGRPLRTCGTRISFGALWPGVTLGARGQLNGIDLRLQSVDLVLQACFYLGDLFLQIDQKAPDGVERIARGQWALLWQRCHRRHRHHREDDQHSYNDEHSSSHFPSPRAPSWRAQLLLPCCSTDLLRSEIRTRDLFSCKGRCEDFAFR